MIIDDIKKISNPYVITCKVSLKDFVGRANEVQTLQQMLDGFKKGARLQNIIISGDKAVGKSTLLHRYSQILEDYNFAVIRLELSTDKKIGINEFDFFYDVINQLFKRYAPPEGTFFDNLQTEMWFSLTSGSYIHGSSYVERKILFATKYANYKKGLPETLLFDDIKSDFEKIITELTKGRFNFSGLAILIDEFQELVKNSHLTDLLRQISESVQGVFIAGAGVINAIDTPVFEKIMRISIVRSLGNFMDKDRLDLIFNPIQKIAGLTRYEASSLFDTKSLYDVLHRSGGNPLHIQVLCQHMFNYFSRHKENLTIALNTEVMDSVMSYYAGITAKSRNIKNSLSTCSMDKLEIFSQIFQYEGFTLKMAILCELAFSKITADSQEEKRRKFFANLREIHDLDLFEFTGVSTELSQIENLSVDKLSNVQYKFIGDTIDKLYVSYLYEGLTHGKQLPHESTVEFRDCLASKLGHEICVQLVKSKIKNTCHVCDSIFSVVEDFKASQIPRAEIQEDFKKLVVNSEKAGSDSEKFLNDVSRKYKLDYPSFLARIFKYQGYYILFTDLEVSGSHKRIVNFIPVKADEGKDFIDDRNELINFNNEIKEPLEDYHIRINWMYLRFVPAEPLLTLFVMDMDQISKKLFEAAGKRDFDTAAQYAAAIEKLDVSVEKEYITKSVDATNNLCFCLININDYDTATEYLRKICDKYLLAKLNLAYCCFAKGRQYWGESVDILKSQIFKKKMGESERVRFINLAIKHAKLMEKDKIVEDVTILQIAAFNLALIYAQQNEDPIKTNSFLKKIVFSGKAEMIKSRVESWIFYYQRNVKKALEIAKDNASRCVNDYLARDIAKDVSIFQSEI